MKSKVMLLGLFMCCLFSSAALAQTRRVSERDALAIVQQQFKGRDVDYLILKDNNNTAWTIFVDAEPMKGWEHTFMYSQFPKLSKHLLAHLCH